MSTPTKARIAIIGAGWWATTAQIPAVQEHPNAILAALCDRDGAKLAAAATAYTIATTYTDLQTMLDQEPLDGAIIVTNHASHFPVAKACLEQGLHILVEKPFTLYATEAKALLDLAAERRREIMVGYPYNYTPYATRSREVIQSGELGAVQYVSAIFSSHIFDLLRGEHKIAGVVHGPGKVYSDPLLSGGGMGHLQMTHPLGLLFFITGLPIQRVHALMQNHGLAVDLVNAFTVEFENGALGSIGGTGNLGGGNGRKQDLQIYCERGSIDIDVTSGACTIYRRGQKPELVEPAVGERDYRRSAPAHNLIDLILGRRQNECPGTVGWQTVELLDAAYRSAQQNGLAVDRRTLYG